MVVPINGQGDSLDGQAILQVARNQKNKPIAKDSLKSFLNPILKSFVVNSLQPQVGKYARRRVGRLRADGALRLRAKGQLY